VVSQWSQDALEAYGPYTATQMLEWQGKGFFKEGVVCREIKEVSLFSRSFFWFRRWSLHCTAHTLTADRCVTAGSQGQDTTWYSSKRVDFDLYID
jgi:hypothetical protein